MVCFHLLPLRLAHQLCLSVGMRVRTAAAAVDSRFPGSAAPPAKAAQGMIAFWLELLVSTDFEGRSCGSRGFDQSCSISLADHFGAIPIS